MLSHSLSFGNDRSELQFIDDLNALCKRHKVHCGAPQDIRHLPSDLASNDNFRIGLFTLCTAISHMAATDLSPQQLSILVARALAGPEASIADAAEIPPYANSAFIEGYERWTQRGPDSDARSIESNPEMASSEPKPGPYYTAASLSSSYLLGMQDSPAVLPANGTSGRHSIPSNTPLESLTLNELRMYLEDIENRVRRIGPHLDRIAHEAVPPEQTEKLAPQPAPENKEDKTIAVSLTTTEIPPSPPAIPIPALPAKAPALTREASPLHRLRIVNAVLACLLLLACTAAGIFAYRYLSSRPQTLADALQKPPLPAVDPTSATNPSTLTNAAQKSDAVSPSPPPAPTTVHRSDDATPKMLSAVSPSASPTTSVATKPPHEDTPSPAKSETKTSSPVTNSLETSTPPRQNQPTPAPTVTDNQNHPLPKIAAAAPTTDPARAAPDRTPAPAVTLTTVAAKSGPSSPPDASTRASLPHPARLADSPVVIPPSMMMTYAIATPKPIYPPLRHSPIPSTVEVAVNISKEGKVTGARVVSGTTDVSSAAVQAVQYWRFRPFLLDGTPVEVVSTFKFVFGPHW
jgi:periplasmic protein TonB